MTLQSTDPFWRVTLSSSRGYHVELILGGEIAIKQKDTVRVASSLPFLRDPLLGVGRNDRNRPASGTPILSHH